MYISSFKALTSHAPSFGKLSVSVNRSPVGSNATMDDPTAALASIFPQLAPTLQAYQQAPGHNAEITRTRPTILQRLQGLFSRRHGVPVASQSTLGFTNPHKSNAHVARRITQVVPAYTLTT